MESEIFDTRFTVAANETRTRYLSFFLLLDGMHLRASFLLFYGLSSLFFWMLVCTVLVAEMMKIRVNYTDFWVLLELLIISRGCFGH